MRPKIYHNEPKDILIYQYSSALILVQWLWSFSAQHQEVTSYAESAARLLCFVPLGI